MRKSVFSEKQTAKKDLAGGQICRYVVWGLIPEAPHGNRRFFLLVLGFPRRSAQSGSRTNWQGAKGWKGHKPLPARWGHRPLPVRHAGCRNGNWPNAVNLPIELKRWKVTLKQLCIKGEQGGDGQLLHLATGWHYVLDCDTSPPCERGPLRDTRMWKEDLTWHTHVKGGPYVTGPCEYKPQLWRSAWQVHWYTEMGPIRAKR